MHRNFEELRPSKSHHLTLARNVKMFKDFDFSLLKDPNFKEDSVREELILPILKRLGYSASPPNQICRSVPLEHPYVYIGSQQKKIHIYPDYLLKAGDKVTLILDAKGPREQISEGKNVEQAYSYAIHKDVRSDYFALCNGYEFTLFHISSWPYTLKFSLKEIDNHWNQLARLVGTEAIKKEAIFYPDLGIGMLRMGFAVRMPKKEKIHHLWYTLKIELVAKVNEDTYSIQSHLEFDEIVFLGTFDFDKKLFEKFISVIHPKLLQEEIKDHLTRNPFTWTFSPEKEPIVGFSCVVSDSILENENEQYLPFIINEFF